MRKKVQEKDEVKEKRFRARQQDLVKNSCVTCVARRSMSYSNGKVRRLKNTSSVAVTHCTAAGYDIRKCNELAPWCDISEGHYLERGRAVIRKRAR
jgi:hypothetical protein